MMTYDEALTANESKAGLDLTEPDLPELLNMIEGLPGWEYMLAEDLMNELARRAGINPEEFLDEHDTDYNGLYQACVEALGIDD